MFGVSGLCHLRKNVELSRHGNIGSRLSRQTFFGLCSTWIKGLHFALKVRRNCVEKSESMETTHAKHKDFECRFRAG